MLLILGFLLILFIKQYYLDINQQLADYVQTYLSAACVCACMCKCVAILSVVRHSNMNVTCVVMIAVQSKYHDPFFIK